MRSTSSAAASLLPAAQHRLNHSPSRAESCASVGQRTSHALVEREASNRRPFPGSERELHNKGGALPGGLEHRYRRQVPRRRAVAEWGVALDRAVEAGAERIVVGSDRAVEAPYSTLCDSVYEF